jgi:sulfur carrier protein
MSASLSKKCSIFIMTLIVNGNKKSFDEKLSLKNLLNHLDLQADRKGIAMCVNMQVIPRDFWDTTELNDGDKIEIVIAAPGG